MKKLWILVFTMSALSVSAVSHCAHCSATMGLRKVDSCFYCHKHYCNKHKSVVSDSSPCERCGLEKSIVKKTAKCCLCDAKKGLAVYESKSAYGSRYGIYCKDHYCATHKIPFSKMCDQSILCRECHQDALAKKSEELKAERDRIAAVNVERRAEPLLSLFGVKFGESRPKDGLEMFAPEKRFRNFSRYGRLVKDGRVISVSTVKVFDDWQSARNEFFTIIELMDKKYDKGRRTGIAQDGLFDLSCVYRFGASQEDFSDAGQKLVITADKVPGELAYQVKIIGGLTKELRELSDARAQEDMDAL